MFKIKEVIEVYEIFIYKFEFILKMNRKLIFKFVLISYIINIRI